MVRWDYAARSVVSAKYVGPDEDVFVLVDEPTLVEVPRSMNALKCGVLVLQFGAWLLHSPASESA